MHEIADWLAFLTRWQRTRFALGRRKVRFTKKVEFAKGGKDFRHAKGERECARRRRQIERGILKVG